MAKRVRASISFRPQAGRARVRPWPESWDLETQAAAQVCESCEQLAVRGPGCCGHRYCRAIGERSSTRQLHEAIVLRRCPLGKFEGVTDGR